MNEINKFMIASLEHEWNDKLNARSKEEQQRVQVLLNELTDVLNGGLNARLTNEQLGDYYATQGDVQQATIHYLKAFEQKQNGEIYEKLAAVYAKANAMEDARYYEVLAAKVRAYSGFSALQQYAMQDAAIQQQAEQMLRYPQSYENWLASVLAINQEELAVFEVAQPIVEKSVPIIEEKRRVHHAEIEREVSKPSVQRPIEQPTVPSVMPSAPTVNSATATQQTSPYVDPQTFIAAQNASITHDESDEFTDFEDMYFGEIYEEDEKG